MEGPWRKAYVSVNLDVDEDGVPHPRLIRWPNGREFPIDQLKDKRRAAYHRFYTDMKWGHAQNYDLTLNSGTLGIDRCVDIIRGLY